MSLVLVIDNYDSFVYNLVQYLGELGADPLVYRHDEAMLDVLVDLDLQGVCKYCHEAVMSGKYDWVLTRIEQVLNGSSGGGYSY